MYSNASSCWRNFHNLLVDFRKVWGFRMLEFWPIFSAKSCQKIVKKSAQTIVENRYSEGNLSNFPMFYNDSTKEEKTVKTNPFARVYLGPTWGSIFFIYVTRRDQEASGEGLGGIFIRVQKSTQNWTLKMSIFRRFREGFGRPRTFKNSVFA